MPAALLLIPPPLSRLMKVVPPGAPGMARARANSATVNSLRRSIGAPYIIAPTRATGLRLQSRSDGPPDVGVVYRSHFLASLFQLPPKSYQKPKFQPGR